MSASSGPPALPTARALRDGDRDRARVAWPWLVASWSALAVATLLALVPLLDGATATTVPPAMDVAVAVAAIAAYGLLWGRRALPVAYLLAVLTALSGVATPMATAATLQVARWYPVRRALPVAVAGFAGHAIQALWRPVALPLGWWLLCDAAVHAALLGWGAYWQARSALLRSLRERARRAEEEQAERVAEARAAERTRIAREMHDTLAHRLSLLAATAGALEYRPDADPAGIARAAGLVRTGVSAALGDLRDIVRVLRAGDGDVAVPSPQPTLDDIDRLVNDTRSAGGVVSYERAGGAEVPAAVGVAAYRIVQEGLTNARRHAPGAAVTVHLIALPGELRVTVRDTGAAGRPRAAGEGAGTGLVGLRERVALLGGDLDAGRHDHGFRLRARLPWSR